MGQLVVLDEKFCYLVYPTQGFVKVFRRDLLEPFVSKELGKHRLQYTDYLHFSPWAEDFSSKSKESVKKYQQPESDFFNKVVDLVNGPKGSSLAIQEFNNKNLTPKSLINFLECWCWIGNLYIPECLVLSKTIYEFSIYERRGNFFLGYSKGDKLISFRYSELLSLGISDGTTFRIETQVKEFNGRLNKKWPKIYPI